MSARMWHDRPRRFHTAPSVTIVSLSLQNFTSYFDKLNSEVASGGSIVVLDPPNHCRQWLVDIYNSPGWANLALVYQR